MLFVLGYSIQLKIKFSHKITSSFDFYRYSTIEGGAGHTEYKDRRSSMESSQISRIIPSRGYYILDRQGVNVAPNVPENSRNTRYGYVEASKSQEDSSESV